jgi:ribulose-5-phosphate 4-epimerase/fuculose-1-phosphate aldolase
MDHERTMGAHAEQLMEFGRLAAAERLLLSTCGNASLRIGDDGLLLSAAGSTLRSLDENSIAELRLSDGDLKSKCPATSEAELHRLVYLARPEIGALLHCQSPAATTLACMKDPPACLDYIPEIPAYVRAHAYIDYAQPGTDALAESVARAFENPEVTVVQMRNHGQVIAGATWQKTVRRAVFFEQACWMALHGRDLTTIPGSASQELRQLSRDI